MLLVQVGDPAIDKLLGKDITGRVLRVRSDGQRCEIQAPEIPEPWIGLLILSFSRQNSLAVGQQCAVWVSGLDYARKVVRLQDRDFGRVRGSERVLLRYQSAMTALLDALDSGGVDVSLAVHLSEVKGMYSGTVLKDRADWFIVWVALGRPKEEDAKAIAAELGSLSKCLRRDERWETYWNGLSRWWADLKLQLTQALEAPSLQPGLNPHSDESTCSVDEKLEVQRLLREGQLLKALNLCHRASLPLADFQNQVDALVRSMISGKRIGQLLGTVYKYPISLPLNIQDLLKIMSGYGDYEGLLKLAHRFRIQSGLETEIDYAIGHLRGKGLAKQADAYVRKFGRSGSADEGPITEPAAKQHTHCVCRADQSIKLCTRNLWERLKVWLPEAPPELAYSIHAALATCPMLLLSDLALIRAYADSIGDAGHLAVLNCSPTWLDFQDLWDRGLSSAWTAAHSNPEKQIIVALESVNLSISALWARPIISLAAGIVDSLKPGSMLAGWPANLSLLFHLNPEFHLFPVAAGVFHLSASLFVPVEPAVLPIPPCNSDSLTTEPLAAPIQEARAFPVPAPFHVTAKRDLQRLTASLGSLGLTAAESSRLSWNLRCERPKELIARFGC